MTLMQYENSGPTEIGLDTTLKAHKDNYSMAPHEIE
jgi:hypothetical protein